MSFMPRWLRLIIVFFRVCCGILGHRSSPWSWCGWRWSWRVAHEHPLRIRIHPSCSLVLKQGIPRQQLDHLPMTWYLWPWSLRQSPSWILVIWLIFPISWSHFEQVVEHILQWQQHYHFLCFWSWWLLRSCVDVCRGGVYLEPFELSFLHNLSFHTYRCVLNQLVDHRHRYQQQWFR